MAAVNRLPHELHAWRPQVATGTGAPAVRPLTATGGTGAANRRGAGGARLLGLLTGPGVGHENPGKIGTGAAYLLALSPLQGHGGKQASGSDGSPAYLLAFTLPVATGRRQGHAPALPLTLAHPAPAGVHREYHLTPPVETTRARMAPGIGLWSTTRWGLDLWRTDGTWHTGYAPTAAALAGADRHYVGGRAHHLSDAELAELTAAGFGSHITLLEVR